MKRRVPPVDMRDELTGKSWGNWLFVIGSTAVVGFWLWWLAVHVRVV